MKKILFWSAVTILAAVSCNKIENDTPAGESNMPSFIASVDGADTKTVIDGKKSYWDGTEGIRVLDGSVSKVYTATVEKAETATFTEKDATTLTGDDYLAVYPEGPAGSVTWDGNITSAAKKFWLPGDQKAVVGSYDPSTHIAVAYAESGDINLNFKNVTALIKVNLVSDNVTEICFYGNNADVIAGNFNVTYNNGEPTWTKEGTKYSNLSYAKVVADEGKTLTKGTYYISVLPATLSKGFSIETVSGGSKSIKKNSKSYTIGRNQIIDLGDVEWVKPAESTTRTIYFYADAWDDDPNVVEVFEAWVWGSTTHADHWVDFKHVSGDYYEADIPKDATGMKMLRKSPTDHNTHAWQSWNESADLTIPSDKNCVNCPGWSGTWTWSIYSAN